MKKALAVVLTVAYLSYEIYSDWQLAKAIARRLS
jgi:hypothetical protein